MAEADIRLVVGADTDLSFDQLKLDIGKIVNDLNQTPIDVKIKLTPDESSIAGLQAEIKKALGNLDLSGAVKVNMGTAMSDGIKQQASEAVQAIEKVRQTAETATKSVESLASKGTPDVIDRTASGLNSVSDSLNRVREIATSLNAGGVARIADALKTEGFDAGTASRIAKDFESLSASFKTADVQWRQFGDDGVYVARVTVNAADSMKNSISRTIEYVQRMTDEGEKVWDKLQSGNAKIYFDTEELAAEAKQFDNTTRAINEYYTLLNKLGSIRYDVTQNNGVWSSNSGDYSRLAAELNRAQKAYDTLTSAEERARLSATHQAEVTDLLTKRKREYAIATDELARKRSEDAQIRVEKAVYDEATQAVNEYYSALQKLTTSNNDVVKDNGVWASASGKFSGLAEELNRTESAFRELTSEENKSRFSTEHQIELVDLLAKKEREYRLVAEAVAEKRSEAAANRDVTSRQKDEALAYEEATRAINEYYNALIKIGTGNNDIYKFGSSYHSRSGEYSNLADELTRLEKAFQRLTSEENKNSLSAEHQAQLTELQTKRQREFVIAAESSVRKSSEAARAKEESAAYAESVRAVNEYYSALKRLGSVKADVTKVNGVWTSESGDFSKLAKELNRTESAFNSLTSAENKSRLTAEQRLALTELETQREREYALAAEASVNKRAEAAAKRTTSELQKEEATAYREVTQAINEYYEALSKLNTGKNDVTKGSDGLFASESGKYSKLADELNRAEEAFRNLTSEETRNSLTAEHQSAITDLLTKKEREYGIASEDAAHKRENATASTEHKRQALLKSTYDQLSKLEALEKEWSKSDSGHTQTQLDELRNNISLLQQYAAELEKGGANLPNVQAGLDGVRASMARLAHETDGASTNTKSFVGNQQSLLNVFKSWVAPMRIMMAAVREIKQMISTAIELDNEFTQLQIVTNATDQTMRDFGVTITDVAQKISISAKDLISATTTFARLGYTLDESSKLAEYTGMLQNVGDIDASSAQDAITAIVKAYDEIDIENIESVMDRLVVVGNNFPISVSQIAEGMNNASSTLAAAGNDFNQSVALLTAANVTIQNAAKSSTGLRTIAARIRNTKTDLEELGEDMTEAKYDELVQQLTHFHVALTDMNGQYRSTYEIMRDIADKWDEMTSMEQAALATALSGTRQQAVFYSIIEQFQEASDAMDRMAGSAGELDRAYDIYLNSITAHINQFKTAFQDLSYNTFTRDLINQFIDLGTSFIGVAEALAEFINDLGGLNTVLGVTISLIGALKLGSIIEFFKGTSLVKGISEISSAISSARAGTQTLSAAFSGLATSANVATVATTALVAIIGTAVIAYAKYRQAQREAREEAIRRANDAANETKELTTLISEYDELSEAVKTDDSVKTDYLKTQEQLLDTLSIEKSRIRELIKEYGNLDDAIKAATIEELQKKRIDLLGGLTASEQNLQDVYSGGLIGSVLGVSLSGGRNDPFFGQASEALRRQQINDYKALDAMARAGYIDRSIFSSYLDERTGERYTQGYDISLVNPGEIKSVEDMVAAAERLYDILELLGDENRESSVYQEVYKVYSNLSEAVDKYKDSVSDLNENTAATIAMQQLMGKDVPETQAAFDDYRQSVIDAVVGTGEFVGTEQDAIDAVDNYLSREIKFQQFYDSIGNAASDAASRTEEETQRILGRIKEIREVADEYNSLTNGNLDYNRRPIVTPEQMRRVYPEFDGDVATTYSMYETITDSLGNALYTFDITPILEDGTVLSAESLRKYIDNLVYDAGIEGVLASDTENLIINIVPGDYDEAYWDGYQEKLQEVKDKHWELVRDLQNDEGMSFSEIMNDIYSNLDIQPVADLADTIESIGSGFDVLKDAEKDMKEGGLSSGTIKALAKETADYNDYLYEENGLIKLNTDSWREYMLARANDNVNTLNDNRDVLLFQRQNIERNLKQWSKLNREGANPVVQQNIEKYTAELEENTAALEDNAAQTDLWRAAVDDAARQAEELSQVGFDSLQSGISALKTAFDDLGAEDSIGVTYSSLSKLKSEFSDVSGIDAYISKILDAGTNTEKVTEILNELISAKLTSVGTTEELASADERLVAAMLDEAGVANADEAAHTLLSRAKAQLEYDSLLAKGGIDSVIDSLANESTYSDQARLELVRLAAQFIATNKTNMDLSQQVAEMERLMVVAFGASAAVSGVFSGVSETRPVVEKPSQKKNGMLTDAGTGTSTKTKNAQADMQSYLNAMLSEINSATATAFEYKPPTPKSVGGGGGGSSKDVEEYIADIDKYYEALKRVDAIQNQISGIQLSIDETDNIDEKIEYTKQLISAYREEGTAIQELNRQRTEGIQAGIKELEALGFQASYNAETHELLIHNMEHLNEISAGSTEATNELRKETEELIDSLEELNDANRDSASTYRSLKGDIEEAKESIVGYLDEVVSKANEMVDGIQNVYTTLTNAAKEYAQTGYLSVDSLQSILDLGPKYLSFLVDENGQLVINEQSLQAVLAARTEEMAAETALSYAKQILLATEMGEIDTLRQLTDVSASASNATWDMAYATLGLAKAMGTANGIDAQFYEDAYSYITKMQSLTKTAVNSISSYYKTLDEDYISQKDGLEKILQLTQDMIKKENDDRVKALEDQKDAYKDIIDQKKELIQLAKEQEDREQSLEEKLAKIAKLQAQISQLALDDSREAQAERRKLEEELADLQKDLANEQADHSVDAQTDALDRELESYQSSKDAEIDALQNMLGSAEQLYQAAIARISSGWDTLYQDLTAWNYEYGNTLQSDLTNAWDAASQAVQRYGSFVAALEGVNGHTNLGEYDANGVGTESYANATYNPNSSDSSRQATARSIVDRMKQNSAQWLSSDAAGKAALDAENLRLGEQLGSYLGERVYRDPDGVWWLNGRKLYDIDVFHKGGVVGNSTQQQDEVLALLEKGEAVLDERRERGLYKLVDFVSVLSEKLGQMLNSDNIKRAFGLASYTPAFASPLSGLVSGAQSIPNISSADSSYRIDRIEVTAPIQVVEKLDEEEIRRHSATIGSISAQYIEDGFTRRGIRRNSSLF